MKPAPFTYHRAHDVGTATTMLAELGDDARLIAGGQSLVAMMAFRLARPSDLIDVTTISGLDYVRLGADGLAIGALTTHHRVETAVELDVDFGVVRATMGWIGHLPIRTRGTVGGSLAHADPSAEWPLLAVLLDAEVLAEGPRGRRPIPAGDFFEGHYSSCLEDDEMVVEVRFPRPARRAAVTEYAVRHGDFAIVSAGVCLDVDGPRVLGGRVALGGVAGTPVRVPAAEAVLASGAAGEDELFVAVADAAADSAYPAGDDATSYRRSLVRTLVLEASTRAVGAVGRP